jgi:hypothetical protein
MNRLLIFAGIWIGLSLMAFSDYHKFYVSVTNVEYAEKEESLQIISRIFIDDLENALKTRYEVETSLATPQEAENADAYITRYFNAKFSVWINGEIREFTFLGKRYDKDLVVCYMEVEGLSKAEIQSVGIQNEILMDIFEEQKNLVHLNILGNKKSFVLIRENNKGMLNL